MLRAGSGWLSWLASGGSANHDNHKRGPNCPPCPPQEALENQEAGPSYDDLVTEMLKDVSPQEAEEFQALPAEGQRRWVSDWQVCVGHNGGKGNQFLKYNLPYQGSGATAGGPVPGGPVPSSATWSKNSQFQISLSQPTRIFTFLEARNVKMDMRDVEGLQKWAEWLKRHLLPRKYLPWQARS